MVAASILLIQNYYTVITRARYGVKLWTEDAKRLAEKLILKSGEKTSSLGELGRLDRSGIKGRTGQHGERLERLREQQLGDREARKMRLAASRANRTNAEPAGLAGLVAGRAQSAARSLGRWLMSLLGRGRIGTGYEHLSQGQGSPPSALSHNDDHTRGGGRDR